MKHTLFLLVLGVCVSLNFTKARNTNDKNETQVVQSERIGHTSNLDTIQPSVSYQNPRNEDDNLNKIVLASLNSKIPEIESPLVVNRERNQLPPSQRLIENPVQSNKFRPPQIISFTNSDAGKAIYQNYQSNPSPTQGISGISHPIFGQNIQQAQRRIDDVISEDFSPGSNNYEEIYDDKNYESEKEKDSQVEHKIPDQDEYGPPQELGHDKPEIRETFFPGFPLIGAGPGFVGPGFVGPGSFDPLPPPPPPPLKGSVDYILIPLILIGLAGPVFVVLYVILGAFEAKLSPITRSLGGLGSYQPYLDTVMSSVGRALDKNGPDCAEYAACQVGNFCNRMGYTNDQSLKTALESAASGKYRRTVRKLFSSMKEGQDCVLKKCLSF